MCQALHEALGPTDKLSPCPALKDHTFYGELGMGTNTDARKRLHVNVSRCGRWRRKGSQLRGCQASLEA